MTKLLITRRSAALAAVAALAAPSLARADNLAKARAAGELLIATELHFAPFDFTEGGRQVGMNSELFAEVGKALNLRIRFQDLPWPGVLPGLEAGRYDLVAGPATITRARMERYRFCAPIADATVALLKRASDASITKPEDINGKTVGCAQATAQLAQLQNFVRDKGLNVQIREYQSFSETYADLAAGRIVAVANSLPNIAYVAQQRRVFAVVQPPFGAKVYFGYLGRKDAESAPLLDAVDGVIDAMRGDGRLAALQTKWFGQAFEVPARITQANA
ncbi:transporter substrate-binding domain-containing protein [Falsiroseomonas selenitidurans]|uniref:Transporter substrate-binding domain-containing protein n=1 Tax=Falsiroseomonas selenitidurans TaxID=2716335 RepID=A0ABX1E7T7_9PROT|nr:transporter substrate-binding domain-containing protein [Falsiroseomonas selenitidurans]NKC32833.1 transporter substrate-binding domain-containing protein [Falsiroseomonas selenitidurans]